MAVKNPEATFNTLLKKVMEIALQGQFPKNHDALNPIRAAQWFGVTVGEYMEWMNGEALPSQQDLVHLADRIRRRQKERSLTYSVVSDEVFYELFSLRDEVETRARMREHQRLRARRQAELREREERLAKTKPLQIVPDANWARFKPDPKAAHSPEEFVQLMRDFREWAGGSEEFSARKLAIWSDGAFSHSTINKILSQSVPFDKKPIVKLSYLVGFIKACGGSPKDVATWTTAWRSAYKQLPWNGPNFPDEHPF